MNVPRFSDFADNEGGALEGEKISIEQLFGRSIVITGVRTMPTRYAGKNKSGLYLQVQFFFEDDDQRAVYCAFTGSDILIRQAEQYQDRIPFAATIKRSGRAFTFS